MGRVILMRTWDSFGILICFFSYLLPFGAKYETREQKEESEEKRDKRKEGLHCPKVSSLSDRAPGLGSMPRLQA
jgi:hypothetical protein